MLPHRLTLEPGAQFAALPSRTEVFLYLLGGQLDVVLGARRTTLYPGDSFHLTLQAPLLTLFNPAAKAAEVLVVNYL